MILNGYLCYWWISSNESDIHHGLQILITFFPLQSSLFPADFLPTERVDIRPERPDFRPVRTWGDRPVNKRSPLYYRTSLLPLTPIRNHAKQGNGYRWPHIGLGWPVFFWQSPEEHGKFVHSSIRLYVRPSVCTSIPQPHLQGFVPFWGPNPNCMAQIQAT